MSDDATASDGRGVVFDVDGTLVDTNYMHTLAWWRAFREVGEDVPMAVIHRAVGMASPLLVEHILGAERTDVIAGHSKHLEPFKKEIAVFAGAGDLLREIHRRGAKVVLATSAKEEDVDRLTSALDAADAIDHVVSSADVDESKPSPQIFELALEIADIRPRSALAVGDTIWDVKAAKRCGIDCIAVTTGGVSRGELKEAGAAAIYEAVDDLLRGLDQSPVARLLDF